MTEESTDSKTVDSVDTESMQEDGSIFIRANGKRNSLTSLIVGTFTLLVAVLMFRILPKNFELLAIFTTSAGIIALLLGYLKIREPDHSLAISKENIDYRHRSGSWKLAWDNVQRIDVPKITSGMEQKQLFLVGIRLKDYGPILDSISPRLMTHLLMEQRPLLLHSDKTNCASGTCYGDDLIEDDYFKDDNGKVYKGVQGMFAHRMQKLRDRLGYDLYINSAELDRPVDEFAELLRSCHRSLLT